MRSLFVKELRLYFTAPIFYAVACVFLIIAGIFFSNAMIRESMFASQIAQYQMNMPVGLTEIVIQPLFDGISLLMLFLVPLFSMRLLAEEKASGTIELLFTYPLTDITLVAAKYLAGLTVLVILIACTGAYMGILAFLSPIDWGVVISSYTGLVLLAGSFLAVGLFASSLTKNQIIAASASFGLILIFWAMGGLSEHLSSGLTSKVITELALLTHLSSFLKGILVLKDAAYYVFFSLFFLALTVSVLESRRWRG
ncbi:MAG TPA: ABC transporter permease subunit [Deltaproteobacteria bacterium]|nr:ABC transporter permease subunit [Deltaproteobacteria bacterium]